MGCEACELGAALAPLRFGRSLTVDQRAWRVSSRQIAGGLSGRPRRVSMFVAGDDGSNITLVVERDLGRPAAARALSAGSRPRIRRSSMQVGYHGDVGEDDRFWLATGAGFERRRLATDITRGRQLDSQTFSLGGGWVRDDHWQLSADYRIDRGGGARLAVQRGLQLAAGAPAAGHAMVAAVAYSPDFGRDAGMRLGLEYRTGRIDSGDAVALGMADRNRSSLMLNLKAGF